MKNKIFKAQIPTLIFVSLLFVFSTSCKHVPKFDVEFSLKISIFDFLNEITNNSRHPIFTKALAQADSNAKKSGRDYLILFEEAVKNIDPAFKLAGIFNSISLSDKINYRSSNKDVMSVLQSELNIEVDRTISILTARFNNMDLDSKITYLKNSNELIVDLGGVKDIVGTRKMLQTKAKLEFYTTVEFEKVYPYLEAANKKAQLLLKDNPKLLGDSKADVVELNDNSKMSKSENNKPNDDSLLMDTSSLINKTINNKKIIENQKLAIEKAQEEENKKGNSLFAYLRPNFDQKSEGNYSFVKGACVGLCLIKDTAKVNRILNMDEIKSIFPIQYKFLWEVKPFDKNLKMLRLIAIKIGSDGKAPLNGSSITEASEDKGETGDYVVSIAMNTDGAKTWKYLTGEHIGECIAIVLDNYVYSFPTVQGEIPNGRSQISCNFTIDEAKSLASLIKHGEMPLKLTIHSENILKQEK